MRVGILTAGGDCPGLNAVIRAAARKLKGEGHEAVGLYRGYRGFVDPSERVELDHTNLPGILGLGGTILQSSSFDPGVDEADVELCRKAQQTHPLDAVIAIGGDHTQAISRNLCDLGFPIIGVPKTIDNDIVGTDRTFGLDTAVQTATDAIDRLRTTAQSHDRVIICEVMGRDSGWIAALSGLAGGADGILVPEVERTVDELASALQRRHAHGKRFSILVVAEGSKLAFSPGEGTRVLASDQRDAFGYERLGGIASRLAPELEARTGFETRVTVLGHLQRGGSPVATDRVLATRYGLHAAELAMEGRFGRMVSLKGDTITSVPLEETVGNKPVDLRILDAAAVFFNGGPIRQDAG